MTFHALLNAHVFTCESRCSLRCACMNTSRMCSHAPFVTATQVSAIRENPHPATCLCGMLFLLMCTCGACGARCGCIDHADRVHAGKAAKSWCLQTERAPGSVSSICNHFITGAAHGHSSSRERLHFASSFSTYLLRELLHCHRSFQTRHCPVHRRCPRGAGRAPDPACRSANAPFGRAARRTHRAQRPALRHNHRRAGASPDAPLLGRLRAP